MTPLELLDSLVKRFTEELKDIKLKDPKNPELNKGINIFPQHLPVKSKESDISLYPYFCIRLTNWEDEDVDSPAKSRILFITGVFDRTDDNQGYRDAIGINQKAYESLLRNPVVEDKFELVHPIRVTYQEEDSSPYYFAGMETNWEIPKPIREDV